MGSNDKNLVKLSQEDLRKLQFIELEMITEVDRICRENDIEYSLDGGTLLGAVRHKGFIPWDDDADVIFTRHEYAKFFRACKKELDTDRFFLQDYKTDPYYRWGYAKLRRNNTEFIRVGQEHMKYRTGVCIDIFVVDNVPDSPVLRRMNYGLNYALRKILYSELGMKQEESYLLRLWYRLLFLIPKKVPFKIRNYFAKINNHKKTELVSHLLFQYPSEKTKYGMPASCFEKYIDTDYEGHKFRIFADYDRYLTLLYGDYMTPPPPEKQKGPGEASKIILIDV